MRFRLVEEILTEDIEAVKKQFPKLSDEQFDWALKNDPTYKEGSNSVGTYTKWILQMLNKGKINFIEEPNDNNLGTIKTIDNEIGTIREGTMLSLLELFDDYKNDRTYKLSSNDINSFKSPDELFSAIENVEENELNANQKRKILDKKMDKESNIQDDYIVAINGWKIYSPSSFVNSCVLGRGTEWCTAYPEDDSQWEQYVEYDHSNLYIFIKGDEKYQFEITFEGYIGDVKDKYDRDFDYIAFIADNDLLDFFYAYTSRKEYEDLKERVEKYINKISNRFNYKDLNVDEIYLLSTDEANKLPKDVRKYYGWWWLRSPGNSQDGAADVYYDGSVNYYGDYVFIDYFCVRPALYIDFWSSNLNSSDFELYSDLELYDDIIVKNGNKKVKFIYIGNGTLLYNGEAIHHRFDDKTNDYEKSEIKKFVENDFLNRVFGNKIDEEYITEKRKKMNELEKMAAFNRKHLKGLSRDGLHPSKENINYNAGNVELNNAIFNTNMGNGTMTSADGGVSAPAGVSGGVGESLEEDMKEIIEYNGFKIQSFDVTWHYNDETFDDNSFIILSNYKVGDMRLPLYCEDEEGNDVNFKSLEEAKDWIDKYKDRYSIKIKHGDEIHAVIDDVSDEFTEAFGVVLDK